MISSWSDVCACICGYLSVAISSLCQIRQVTDTMTAKSNDCSTQDINISIYLVWPCHFRNYVYSKRSRTISTVPQNTEKFHTYSD